MALCWRPALHMPCSYFLRAVGLFKICKTRTSQVFSVPFFHTPLNISVYLQHI
jgi:hypothetical protein